LASNNETQISPVLPSVPEGHIPVVASTDDNYAIPLMVMFISLLENSNEPETIHLFIIDGGVSEKKKADLIGSAESRGSQATFLEIDSELYSEFPTRAHISAPAYYRISIPELFDQKVERCIYLDCDLIVNRDIKELWEVDLDGYAVGAVENVGATFKASQLQQTDYFNSGVLVIDLKSWRESGIPEKVRAFKLEHPELISTNDQCALNGVFRGEWKRLPLSWNFQSGLYQESPQVDRFRQSGELDGAIWDPCIIHYIGWSKPWVDHCFHPLEGEYRRYADLSPHENQPRTEIPDHQRKRFVSLFKKKWRQKAWQKKYKQQGRTLY